jgi:hypothetical protein
MMRAPGRITLGCSVSPLFGRHLYSCFDSRQPPANTLQITENSFITGGGCSTNSAQT